MLSSMWTNPFQVSAGGGVTCGPAPHEGEDVLEEGHLQQHGGHRAVHGRGNASQRQPAEWERQPGPHREHCTSAKISQPCTNTLTVGTPQSGSDSQGPIGNTARQPRSDNQVQTVPYPYCWNLQGQHSSQIASPAGRAVPEGKRHGRTEGNSVPATTCY